MDWLNYHHLLYFWTVVKEGSVVRASETLRLSQPTVSSQVRALEAALGERLFTKVGRRLVPTDTGQLVYRYADDIFSLGREMVSAVRGGGGGRPVRFVVGVTDVLSKLIAYRLLAPALQLKEPVRMVCREDRVDRLLAALAVHDVDLVLSDTPVPPGVRVQAFSHLLGESDVSFFAVPALASRLKRRFPASLADMPVLWPGEGTVLRRQLDEWLRRAQVRPRIVGEFDDSALMKAFAEHGAGAFAAPTVIADDLRRRHGVVTVARLRELRERVYAISSERRITHPAVAAIASEARAEIFART
jgi:LysR family transcriptional activator of nhaA